MRVSRGQQKTHVLPILNRTEREYGTDSKFRSVWVFAKLNKSKSGKETITTAKLNTTGDSTSGSLQDLTPIEIPLSKIAAGKTTTLSLITNALEGAEINTENDMELDLELYYQKEHGEQATANASRGFDRSKLTLADAQKLTLTTSLSADDNLEIDEVVSEFRVQCRFPKFPLGKKRHIHRINIRNSESSRTFDVTFTLKRFWVLPFKTHVSKVTVDFFDSFPFLVHGEGFTSAEQVVRFISELSSKYKDDLKGDVAEQNSCKALSEPL